MSEQRDNVTVQRRTLANLLAASRRAAAEAEEAKRVADKHDAAFRSALVAYLREKGRTDGAGKVSLTLPDGTSVLVTVVIDERRLRGVWVEDLL